MADDKMFSAAKAVQKVYTNIGKVLNGDSFNGSDFDYEDLKKKKGPVLLKGPTTKKNIRKGKCDQKPPVYETPIQNTPIEPVQSV